jgi:hypothetical protein
MVSNGCYTHKTEVEMIMKKKSGHVESIPHIFLATVWQTQNYKEGEYHKGTGTCDDMDLEEKLYVEIPY